MLARFKIVKKAVSSWAHTLMTNHLTHIQENTERTATAVEKLCVFQEKTQGEILTGIEVLKDRE